MSRHEGVSCDSCMRTNFRGKRYKCLVCYDYDLCETCYESSLLSATRSSSENNRSNHSSDHAMQCMLTQMAYDLFYTGETNGSQTLQSITCPICGSLGFTEATLITHVSQAHSSHSHEVVCPLCATSPNGDPNFVTEDYARHLARTHNAPRASSNTTSATSEEERAANIGGISQFSSRRRGTTTSGASGSTGVFHSGRAILRRRNGGVLNLTSSTSAATTVGGQTNTGTSANIVQAPQTTTANGAARDRDSVVDPIAELLSQLSGVRRAGGAVSRSNAEHQAVLNSTASHLQQLQWQLQMERQSVVGAHSRDHLSRIPRRSYGAGSYSSQSSANNAHGGATDVTQSAGTSVAPSLINVPASATPLFNVDVLSDSRFLLRNFNSEKHSFTNDETERTESGDSDLKIQTESESSDIEKHDFVQDLTFSLLQIGSEEPLDLDDCDHWLSAVAKSDGDHERQNNDENPEQKDDC